MLERASRYSELLAKAERKADKQRAEAVALGGGAFASADQDADSVSMDGGSVQQVRACVLSSAQALVACHACVGRRSRRAGAGVSRSRRWTIVECLSPVSGADCCA
jgi:hypothetical protein